MRSCHFYTAHPIASKQVSSIVIPWPKTRHGFDETWFANDASSMVHLRSPPHYSPCKVFTSLSMIVHYLSVSLKAASSGLLPEPALRVRWACHHLYESYELFLTSQFCSRITRSRRKDTASFRIFQILDKKTVMQRRLSPKSYQLYLISVISLLFAKFVATIHLAAISSIKEAALRHLQNYDRRRSTLMIYAGRNY